jgi:hypothetical protein
MDYDLDALPATRSKVARLIRSSRESVSEAARKFDEVSRSISWVSRPIRWISRTMKKVIMAAAKSASVLTQIKTSILISPVVLASPSFNQSVQRDSSFFARKELRQ